MSGFYNKVELFYLLFIIFTYLLFKVFPVPAPFTPHKIIPDK